MEKLGFDRFAPVLLQIGLLAAQTADREGRKRRAELIERAGPIRAFIPMLLPNERPEKMFSTMVNWGRFAELFGFNKDEDRFYLDQE